VSNIELTKISVDRHKLTSYYAIVHKLTNILQVVQYFKNFWL